MSWRYWVENSIWFSQLKNDNKKFNHGDRIAIIISGIEDSFRICKHGNYNTVFVYFETLKIVDSNAEFIEVSVDQIDNLNWCLESSALPKRYFEKLNAIDI